MTAGSLERIRAVVTGGADSTGLAVARQLAARGARVHVADVRKEAIDRALRDNPGFSGTIADVASASDVSRLVNEARQHLGRLNTLVSVVGVSGPQAPVEHVSDAEWAQTFAVNVNGLFYAVRAVVPDMKAEGWGVIVTFSSGSTRTNFPHRLPYVASKWAVEGITRALARELGPHQIRVNAILPGMIDNARMRLIIERKAVELGCTAEELTSQYLKFISMHTAIAPDEIAAAVTFLCSDEARHITGQLLGVDGNVEWEP